VVLTEQINLDKIQQKQT